MSRLCWLIAVLVVSPGVLAQRAGDAGAPDDSGARAGAAQAEREESFRRMLSGATLEGSYTTTGGADGAELKRDKYTLGEVRKIAEHLWLIPARIEYGEHDVTLPVPVPVYWADQTPVVVIDEVELPGFGKVSARVLFADDHYAGYWKHGEASGHLFGTIRRGNEASGARLRGDAPAGEQVDEQRGQQQAIDDK